MPINIMILGIHIVSVYRLFSKIAMVALTLVVLFTACDTGGDPKLPAPGKVQMVAHSFTDDTLAVERGIDAVPESNGIYLSWYSLRNANIDKYNIYRWKGRKNEQFAYFSKFKVIDLNISRPGSGKDTTFTDDNEESGLELNAFYSYFITATNKDGLEGTAEDTLEYMLLEKPETRWPDGQTFDSAVDSLPILSWDFADVPDQYILRIENNFNQLKYIGIFQVTEYFSSQTLDMDSIADLPPLTPGTYIWRIDIIGPYVDTSGSESNEKVFIIN
jgi:hypothetical protein